MAVSYASLTLNEIETSYNTTKKEWLAIAGALRKYGNLLLGFKVHILTDNRQLLDFIQ